MSVVSKLQFTHAFRSSHSWLSKQPQLVLLVASLSCAELGTAQPQLVFIIVVVYHCSCYIVVVHIILIVQQAGVELCQAQHNLG